MKPDPEPYHPDQHPGVDPRYTHYRYWEEPKQEIYALQARLSWLESRFLDFVQIQQSREAIGGTDSIPIDIEIQNSGNPLLNSPKFKVSVAVDWAFDFAP